MLPRSIPPNHFTHPLLSKACVDLCLVGNGEKSHARTLKSGQVSDARKAFDRMPRRNRVSWNSMVAEYVAVGEMEEAMVLFMRMSERVLECGDGQVCAVQGSHESKGAVRLDA
ncbi:Pentatricopeptide repeat-containing protein [Acorus gramineus]|uniref:Pentatricopeptide repeat-containing protein n=1 Tax=Acorus gramineus TaxID=55184 RepID=A0AAV9B0L7_ACOGR|nr:Pentatricopeptide repeat-containing protein [Acorus gramineus]